MVKKIKLYFKREGLAAMAEGERTPGKDYADYGGRSRYYGGRAVRCPAVALSLCSDSGRDANLSMGGRGVDGVVKPVVSP